MTHLLLDSFVLMLFLFQLLCLNKNEQNGDIYSGRGLKTILLSYGIADELHSFLDDNAFIWRGAILPVICFSTKEDCDNYR